MGNDSFMTVHEVASRLRVKVSWVYSHADELGAYRLGKYLRFSWSRVLECLSHRAKMPGSSNDAPYLVTAPVLDRIGKERNGDKTIA